MRAADFLNETELNELVTPTAGSDRSITINIPANLFAAPGPEAVAEEQEETDEAVEVQQEPTDHGIESATAPDELADIVRLSRGEHREPTGQNHTIAAPAGSEVPENPVFVSPLQQQLELQKQQGGKESPIINQIIDDTILGSTAGEQPEQSVYHDSPLKDNEWVGAGTGEVEEPRNRTTTQGATKPWYKL
jgi:hypothetical protein